MTNPTDNHLSQILSAGIHLRAQKVIDNLDAVLVDPNPQATHDLSTSLRRLLVAHQVSVRLFNWNLFQKHDLDQIKRFRLNLGKVRDVQEIFLKVKALDVTDKLITAFLVDLTSREITARRLIQTAIKDFDQSSILSLAQVIQNKHLDRMEPQVTIEDMVLKYYQRVSGLYQQAVSEQSDNSLHRMRLQYKRMRYTLELLAPVINALDNNQLTYLKTFQQMMGEAHDWYLIEAAFKSFSSKSGTAEEYRGNQIERAKLDYYEAARSYIEAEWSRLKTLISSVTGRH